jgi:hypothetical protein
MCTLRLCILACVIAPFAASAQRGPTERGSILVGGSANVGKEEREVNDTETSTTAFSFAPEALFFFSNQLAIGGRVTFGHSSGDNSRSSSWGIGPAFKYFLSKNSTGALPFVGASVSFQTGDARFTGVGTVPDQEFEFESEAYEGVAGILWMLSRQVGLTGEAYARRAEVKDTPAAGAVIESTTTNLGVRFGFSAFILGGGGGRNR